MHIVSPEAENWVEVVDLNVWPTEQTDRLKDLAAAEQYKLLGRRAWIFKQQGVVKHVGRLVVGIVEDYQDERSEIGVLWAEFRLHPWQVGHYDLMAFVVPTDVQLWAPEPAIDEIVAEVNEARTMLGNIPVIPIAR